MIAYKKYLLILLGIISSTQSFAVTGVNPSGVNVRHNGASTIFLTFQDLDTNEVAQDAFWCGEVTATGVSATNPCVSGTIFGHLPVKIDRSQKSTAGSFTNLTDIMSIPPSVVRRAFQAAIKGANSDFFYVRHFTGGDSGDRYVTVTCRLAGGGARTPLSLLDVQVGFTEDKGVKDPVYLVERNKTPSGFAATVLYNGTGRLKGRWEVKLPGEPEPTVSDLLTEASLPIEKRGLQRRYTVLSNFDIFVNPTGKVVIPGPDVSKIPHRVDGMYKILLRIEATRDKEGNSNTGAGTVVSGGVAGFPMPVLRYYVGPHEKLNKIRELAIQNNLQLMLPQNEQSISSGKSHEFSWIGVKDVKFYRLVIKADNKIISSAIVPAGQESYMAPEWIFTNENSSLKWSVEAIDNTGDIFARSKTRSIKVK